MGTYDKRFNERLGKLEEQSSLAGMLHDGSYDELRNAAQQQSGISIRHPKIFVKDQGLFGIAAAGSVPNRVFPPGIPIPGFTYTHESYQKTSEGINVSYYVYHGMIPVSEEMSADAVKGMIEASIANRLPDSQLRWETVDLPTTGGDTVSWQKLKLLTGQDFAFYRDGDADVSYRQMDGHLLFCVHSTSKYHVIMAWRVPAEINESIKFLESADACMGSIREDASS